MKAATCLCSSGRAAQDLGGPVRRTDRHHRRAMPSHFVVLAGETYPLASSMELHLPHVCPDAPTASSCGGGIEGIHPARTPTPRLALDGQRRRRVAPRTAQYVDVLLFAPSEPGYVSRSR
jgi:hypothetical protein